MTLVLDTNILIELIRRRPNPIYRQRLNEARRAGEDLSIPSICLHELMYGALRSARPSHHMELIQDLVSDLDVDSWTAEDAVMGARLRAQLAALGQPIDAFDMQVAAYALRREAALVTNNLRHFFRPRTLLDDLPLIDWSISDQPLDKAALAASLRRPQKD